MRISDWSSDVCSSDLGLSPLHKVLFETLEAQAAMPIGYFGVSTAMPPPILIRYCDDKAWVRERVIAALSGAEIWCQLFSEPAAGSDLAGLRMKAARGPEGWTLNGQQLWTTFAQYADYCILIDRKSTRLHSSH